MVIHKVERDFNEGIHEKQQQLAQDKDFDFLVRTDEKRDIFFFLAP